MPSAQRQPDDRPVDPRRTLGSIGEDLALKHMRALGFTEIARNHRTRHGEIDLIMGDRCRIVIVEVKTRRMRRTCSSPGGPAGTTTPMLIMPLQGLNREQRVRLRRMAATWLQESAPRRGDREIRFDAIGVIVDRQDRLLRLDHVEGAW